MKRVFLITFGLFLIFAVIASVVVAQPMRQNIANIPQPVACPPNIDCLDTPTPPPGGQVAHSGDEDGDGIPDGIDQCPNDGGPSSNVGCPPGQEPAAPDTGAAQVPAPPALPVMPVTGDCVLATRSDEGVNIRIQPSTNAEIVGGLDPQLLYPVDGQHSDTDGTWNRIDEGWVARRVVRVGGNCDTVPEITLVNPPYSLDTISCDVDELINAIKNAANGSTINLAPGCIYTLTKPYLDTIYGLPTIKITLKINGNGATIRRSSAGGTPAFSIFHILGFQPHYGLTLNDLTLRNGKSVSDLGPYYGGCDPCGAAAIENEGGDLVLNNTTLSNNSEGGAVDTSAVGATMTVTNSTFAHNTSRVGGGAISNSMALTITNSTFSDNSGSGFDDGEGGAIYNGGTLIVTDSTFSNNVVSGDGISTHGDGGAIFNYGTLTVSSSTFSGNRADYGGGIENAGAAAVSNSTFYNNVAATGGGAIYNPGILTVTNSTVASNFGGSGGGGIDNSGSNLSIPGNSNKASVGSSIFSGNSGPDLLGVFKSLGHNVIGSIIGATITGTSTGNLINAAASPLNLGDLSSNGGPTQTQLIGLGSVAIGAGNCTSMAGTTPVTTDQRGQPRKPTCDIGAYES